MNTDFGYLQHGGDAGPFRTEKVNIRGQHWPNADQWQAFYEGQWRNVYMQCKRLYIVYRGARINIKIEGV